MSISDRTCPACNGPVDSDGDTMTAAVTRDDIDRALINVTSNAMNYPIPSQMLGKDSGPLRRKCVEAVCNLFGIR